MSIFTSARKVINRVQGKSSYLFREHSYNEPPPPDFSPMHGTVKRWFAQEKYREGDFKFVGTGGYAIEENDHHYITTVPGINEAMPFKLKLCVLMKPGDAELAYLNLELHGGAYGNSIAEQASTDISTMYRDEEGKGVKDSPYEKAAARIEKINWGGLYLERAQCLYYTIDPRRFEVWLVNK